MEARRSSHPWVLTWHSCLSTLGEPAAQLESGFVVGFSSCFTVLCVLGGCLPSGYSCCLVMRPGFNKFPAASSHICVFFKPPPALYPLYVLAPSSPGWASCWSWAVCWAQLHLLQPWLPPCHTSHPGRVCPHIRGMQLNGPRLRWLTKVCGRCNVQLQTQGHGLESAGQEGALSAFIVDAFVTLACLPLSTGSCNIDMQCTLLMYRVLALACSFWECGGRPAIRPPAAAGGLQRVAGRVGRYRQYTWQYRRYTWRYTWQGQGWRAGGA